VDCAALSRVRKVSIGNKMDNSLDVICCLARELQSHGASNLRVCESCPLRPFLAPARSSKGTRHLQPRPVENRGI
jgi:hypothetical protein